ncbi:hypothetical protein [Faucicola atlantae]|uniref:hypothetical protein n=1 Tax=Faucicola atlantae TaxID=34059 RepID=UPI0025B25EF2|nr:hypothetical protein [Moraxella atlantae]
MSTQNDNDSANHQASDQPISSHQEHGGIIDKIKEGIDEAKESLRSKLSDTINELGKAKTVAQSTLVGMELDDIQAIILRDRPIPYYGTVVAIKVHHAAKGRELIAKLLPHVSSSQEFDERMASNLTIVMTYEGLKQLGVPQDSLDSFPENFKQGMAARAKQLHDVGQNAPENWQKPFGTGQIHVCAAVIADSKANWQKNYKSSNRCLMIMSIVISLIKARLRFYLSMNLAWMKRSKTCLASVMVSATPMLQAVVSKNQRYRFADCLR